MGISIFPNSQSLVMQYGLTISEADLQRYLSKYPKNFQVMLPVVIACIIYKQAGTAIWHSTPTEFDIMALHPGQLGSFVVPVAPEQLAKTKFVMFDTNAANAAPD